MTARERMVRVVAETLGQRRWRDSPWSAHNKHRFDAFCAICQGDVGAIAEAAVAALEAEMGLRETAPLTNFDTGETFRQLCTGLIGDDDE